MAATTTYNNRNRIKVKKALPPLNAGLAAVNAFKKRNSVVPQQILVQPTPIAIQVDEANEADEDQYPRLSDEELRTPEKVHIVAIQGDDEAEEDVEKGGKKTNLFFREDVFRHPYTRIATCLLMILLEFCFNAENVVSRSHAEMTWAMVGPAMNFLIRQWPMLDRLWLMATKVGMVAAFCFVAISTARKYVHPFFGEYLGLSMFGGKRGDVCCFLMVIIPALYAGAQAYNTIVINTVDSDSIPLYYLTDSLSTSNAQYYSHRQGWDWIVCFLTLIMVIDAVLQDTTHFAHWQEYRKHQWITAKRGFQRVLTVWVLAGGLSLLGFWLGDACFALRSNPEEDILGTGIFGTDEVSQITLCSLLFASRLVIIMQDPEFPQFGHTEGTKIAGTIAEGRLTIYYLPGAKNMIAAAEAAAERAKELAANAAGMITDDNDGPASPNPRLQQFWQNQKTEEEDEKGQWTFQIHLDGKWLVYGPLLLTLCLDSHTMYQLMEYVPNEYEQRVVAAPAVAGQEETRWLVYSSVGRNSTFGETRHLNGAFWTWQNSEANGGVMPYDGMAKLGVYYRYSAMRERMLAAIPAALALLMFLVVIVRYNVVGYNEEGGDEEGSDKMEGAEEEEDRVDGG
jgi:hypothetical protein